MSVVHYFSILDTILIQQAVHIKSKSKRKTVRLKDLVAGNESLFDFVCWLVSDNERELFFSRNCAIKFFHCQANNQQLKVKINR